MTLRIGQIDYANCVPIFTALKNNFDCSNYRFVRGVPAELNRKLSSGDIDVSPSSSFEYGKSSERYCILPDLSISSVGPVRSVLLFSRLPIEQLNGQRVGLTAESDTSVNLLKIILKKFYGFDNAFERSALPLRQALTDYAAMLLIGDTALKEAMQCRDLYVYDLGELWHSLTGLPFVFALWIVRREVAEEKGGEIRAFCADLRGAKGLASRSFGQIAAACQETSWMSEKALIDYWRTISYELTPLHVEGVMTFFRYATDLRILEKMPELRIFA